MKHAYFIAYVELVLRQDIRITKIQNTRIGKASFT